MKKLLILFFCFASILACKQNTKNTAASKTAKAYSSLAKSGDIVFQTSLSDQSKAIQLASHSKYSHVGIVLKENEKLMVLEAVQPVKLTPLSAWINRGEKQHFVVKRLKDYETVFTEKKMEKAFKIGKAMLGKNYDAAFEWSDKKIYCSELVWKIYKKGLQVKLCKVKKLEDFDLENEVVQAKLQERYGKKIPLKEKVVSPQDIFDSDKLETVFEQ